MSLQMLFAIASIAAYFSVNAVVVRGPTLPAGQAIHAIGKVQIVCGIVSRIRQARKDHLQPTFIYLGDASRKYAFEIAIAGNDLPRFNPGPAAWNGTRICVRGRIGFYAEHPIIIAANPNQISPGR